MKLSLILLAREHGRQLQAVEAFFRSYFVDAIDLTSTDNLIQIGKEAGLEAETVELLLNSNTGKVEIEMAEKELHDLGITAVPLFIINNRLAISGAQPVEAFAKAFEEAREWATIARQ